MMMAEPQKEHAWLQRMVGDWTYESEMQGPEGPMTSRGTETVRSLGGLWVIGEGTGEMPGGGAASMIITLGYDADAKKFVGSWIGSVMTKMWVYDCEMDADGRTLLLNAEGPSMSGSGKIVKYQDAVEVVDDDTRKFYGRVQDDDGNWVTFMTATYRRVS